MPRTGRLFKDGKRATSQWLGIRIAPLFNADRRETTAARGKKHVLRTERLLARREHLLEQRGGFVRTPSALHDQGEGVYRCPDFGSVGTVDVLRDLCRPPRDRFGFFQLTERA